MPTFHDRRGAPAASVDTVKAAIGADPKDTYGKALIDGRYLIRGQRDPEVGRVGEFVVHEVLANGRVIERGRADRRYRANALTEQIAPTDVYDL